MEEPKNIYSEAEYRAADKELREAETANNVDGGQKRTLLEIIDRIEVLEEIQRKRLPVYLLARCPFCGGRVSEGIDTFSLNGRTWHQKSFRGVGWFGPIPALTDEERQKYAYMDLSGGSDRPSFEAECDHVQCVDWCVNLDGQEPSEVNGFSEKTEVPHLITRLMNYPETLAVMNMLPLRRIDAPGTRPFKIFFMTYFSEDRDLMRKVINSMNISDYDDYISIHPPWDYDLQKWVKLGRLYWLDPDDPEGKILTKSVDSFPYGNITGHREGLTIRDGKIVYSRSFWQTLKDMFK
jgi:hypothetical protein